MSRNEARFSTYSGAPSLQPSLAPTLDTTSNRSSTHPYGSRCRTTQTIPENCRRPIYANIDPNSFASCMTLSGTDSKTADIRSFARVLDRMADARTEKQRFVMSSNKTEEVSKIALGAKVERALRRRMVKQDAIFTTRKALDEKRALEVAAN